MNKSILKHEIKSIKWISLLSILTSLFLTVMFSLSLDRQYGGMFSGGINLNEAIIKGAFREIAYIILIAFTIISIVQIFMQFRSEKDQEIARFLQSLPVKKGEFFKIKLLTGLLSLSLSFIVLLVGLLLVRNNNLFWIKDIEGISYMPRFLIESNGIVSLLKELGLIYFIVISFYTFLFMVQYTFSNLIGAIVTSILVWLAPIFMINTSIYTLERFLPGTIYNSKFIVKLLNTVQIQLPWAYPFDYNYISLADGRILYSISRIIDLPIKYIICFVLILINIGIAYKFNKDSKIEDENMIISFKSTKIIFKLGVTICSALLVSAILMDVLSLQLPKFIFMICLVIGGAIGYFISKKITRIGTI